MKKLWAGFVTLFIVVVMTGCSAISENESSSVNSKFTIVSGLSSSHTKRGKKLSWVTFKLKAPVEAKYVGLAYYEGNMYESIKVPKSRIITIKDQIDTDPDTLGVYALSSKPKWNANARDWSPIAVFKWHTEPEDDASVTSSKSDSSKSTSSASASSSSTVVTREERNALIKAKLYSDVEYKSRQGIYDQLVSSYGEGFSKTAAKYAVDHLKTDYNRNALEKAKMYQSDEHMSREKIRVQLTSSYGEKFTVSQANYAISHLPK